MWSRNSLIGSSESLIPHLLIPVSIPLVLELFEPWQSFHCPYNRHTLSLGYVHNSLGHQFDPPGARPFKTEHGLEFNTLLDPLPMLLLQPVVQYFTNVGGGPHRAVVFGFRTKVEF
jgi:hypothetical protein